MVLIVLTLLFFMLLIWLTGHCQAGECVVVRTDSCSSVWFASDDEFIYGLTASHCCRSGGEVRVHFEAGIVNARVVDHSVVRDVALLKAFRGASGIAPDGRFGRLSEGEAEGVGFPGGRLARVPVCVTMATWSPRDPPGTSLKRVVEVQAGSAGPGMSGGGVFQDGVLVAIWTHGCGSGCHGGVSALAGPEIGRLDRDCVGGKCGLIDRVVDRQVSRVREELLPSGGELVAAAAGGGVGFWAGRRRGVAPQRRATRKAVRR